LFSSDINSSSRQLFHEFSVQNQSAIIASLLVNKDLRRRLAELAIKQMSGGVVLHPQKKRVSLFGILGLLAHPEI